MRPALASRLIDTLGAKAGVEARQFECELVALELHYLASIMLDALHNGIDLAESQGREKTLAPPVLITLAYSLRQFAPTLVRRHSTSLPPAERQQLAWRFARLLHVQGIGHTLDLWGGQNGVEHPDAASLLHHLQWYLG